MNKKSVAQNYTFLGIMLGAMILGALFGWLAPSAAAAIKPLGTVFINMMFCIVVPLVFASISGAVANMKSRKRAGKIMGTTIATFVVTGAIAAVIMFLLVQLFPPVLTPWTELQAEEMGEYATISDMIVNFFTTSDFVGLLSRRAMLPLIVFSILFGFAVNLNGGSETLVAKFLEDLTNVMLKFVKIVTYYAPIAFFAIFADLVASYGPQITESYGRALLLYYPLCVVYIFTAFPLFAWFGGGKGAVKVMFQHIVKPAVVSLGTCSSVATIPTNMEEAEATGISKDVSDMVLPLGATMHMDGSVFSAILKISFLFGFFGMPFDGIGTYVTALMIAIFSGIAMSGVAGGGFVGEMVIVSLFFPEQMGIAFPVIATIGALVDPPATCINASGDTVASMIVARFVEGKDWFQKKQAERAEKAGA